MLALGCFWRGDARKLEPVDERDVLLFAERIATFYATLARRSLDAYLTYEDESLRDYFDSPGAFSDYYASLANQVRDAHLRNSSAREVRVREFRFEDPDTVRVDLLLVGRHERGLRFWDIELERTDTWRRARGTWVLAPEKL